METVSKRERNINNYLKKLEIEGYEISPIFDVIAYKKISDEIIWRKK